jgi:hypothetical protein
MSRQRMSLNTLSGSDNRDLSVQDPAGRIRVSAWPCQILSDFPACYLGITRGWVGTFYLPVLSLYGFNNLLTNPFPIFYLLLNSKLPVLVLIWGLRAKKLESVFPHIPYAASVDKNVQWSLCGTSIDDIRRKNGNSTRRRETCVTMVQ